MDQRLIQLYDDYTHRHFDRRLLLEGMVKIVGSTGAAIALLPLLQSNYAVAQTVSPSDERLGAGPVTYPGASGPVKGYLARPKGDSKLPGVVVIHENRGVTPHIQDVARRAALAGYIALAPDLMSSIGGTLPNEEESGNKFKELDANVALQDAVKSLAYVRSRPDSSGKIGAVGFCWGGGMVNRLAETVPDLDAAAAFYGPVPPLDQVAKIKAPLLLHYAGNDNFVNPKVPDYEAALKQAGVKYTAYMYDGVQHAFHNDTSAARYNADAAKLAWQRTIEFFDRHLKA
jgi:carboxymethylenebutenolidase